MVPTHVPPCSEGDPARPVAWLLTPVAPDPEGTGLGLRAWAWLSTLSRSHQVRVLVVAPGPGPGGIPGDWVFAGPQVAYTRHGWLLLGWCLPWLARLTRAVVMDWRHWRPPPGQAPAWPPDGASERVDRIVAFRICVHEFARVAARHFPQARLEIDLDDLESDTRFSIARAQLRLLRWGQALRTASVAWQYRCLEAPVLAHYDQAWLAAPEDVRRLRARMRAGPAVGCLPNRLQAPAVPPGPPPPGEPFDLLFVGSLDYLPNEEGVLWLLRRVVPHLRRVLPAGWRLSVVGRHAGPALARRLRREPEVEFWPDAPSLGDFYARAQVALVPLRSGGGTKLKALEAFAWRRPVVTTSHGARGLGVSDGVHCLVADDAAAFANRLLWLREQPVRAAQLADAAWARFEQAFALPADGSPVRRQGGERPRQSDHAHPVHRLP